MRDSQNTGGLNRTLTNSLKLDKSIICNRMMRVDLGRSAVSGVIIAKVFISYRREDTQGEARALFQYLVERVGRDSVFMDVDSIAPGRDFREVVQEHLASCDLMLALIGKDWVDGIDTLGRRRLDNTGDFVRLEIAAALKRNIRITPLLLQGAQMPTAEQLPADLTALAYRNAFEVSHNRWDSDVKELMKRLSLEKTEPAATVPRMNNLLFLLLTASAVGLAITGGGFLYKHTLEKPVQIGSRIMAENAQAKKSRHEAENIKTVVDVGKATAKVPRAPA